MNPNVADLFRQRFRREARQGKYVMHFAEQRRLNDDISIYFADATLPSAFVARWCQGAKVIYEDRPETCAETFNVQCGMNRRAADLSLRRDHCTRAPSRPWSRCGL